MSMPEWTASARWRAGCRIRTERSPGRFSECSSMKRRRLPLSTKGKSLAPWELSGTMRKSCRNFRKRRVVNWDLCFQRITGAGESCRKRSGGSSGICLMRLGWIFLPAAIMWKMNGRKGYRKNVVSAITGWSKRKPATEKKGTAGCRY